MLLWLTGIGVFAAIYHPVGIPWLVRNSGSAKGKALAFNGIFGSLGGAAAGLTSGWLIDLSGWSMAFIVPGIACIVAGLVLALCIVRGMVYDGEAAFENTQVKGRGELARVFFVLVVTIFLAGMIYQGTQCR